MRKRKKSIILMNVDVSFTQVIVIQGDLNHGSWTC